MGVRSAVAQELCVSPEQRRLHVATEALAVFAVTPFMIWLATRQRELSKVERAGIWAILAGTLIVDGTLLYRWLSGNTTK